MENEDGELAYLLLLASYSLASKDHISHLSPLSSKNYYALCIKNYELEKWIKK